MILDHLLASEAWYQAMQEPRAESPQTPSGQQAQRSVRGSPPKSSHGDGAGVRVASLHQGAERPEAGSKPRTRVKLSADIWPGEGG